MARVFSGIQPTGELHLGNYLGAVTNWVRDLDVDESVFCIVDLHALTVPKDPVELRSRTLDLAAMLIAAGLDPDRCTLFLQSHVRAHAELGWLMECTVAFGELRRMTQFKDKYDRAESVSAGFFTYPALQAADILLYDTEKVPVGDDQRQHIELARDLAERFNARYGATFVVPSHSIPPAGARVMDLQEPMAKMSKSRESEAGTVFVKDEPAAIEKKFKRAVTDSDGTVRYDPIGQPGVANLLSILGACNGETPERVATRYEQYGALKADCASAVIELLAPVRARHEELRHDQGALADMLAAGAEKARAVAEPVVDRARAAVGLTDRPR